MKTCQDCGAKYYKLRRDDSGICDACRKDAATSLGAAATQQRKGQDGDLESSRLAYRAETKAACDKFYAKKRAKAAGKRRPNS